MLHSMTAFDPSKRGYSVTYRVGQTTVPSCPGCGRTQWIIGRHSAECVFCSLVLPLADGPNQRAEAPTIKRRGDGGGRVQ